MLLTGKDRGTWKKNILVPLFSTQILHGFAWDWNQTSSLAGQ